jgi:hypothetical protein
MVGPWGFACMNAFTESSDDQVVLVSPPPKKGSMLRQTSEWALFEEGQLEGILKTNTRPVEILCACTHWGTT